LSSRELSSKALALMSADLILHSTVQEAQGRNPRATPRKAAPMFKPRILRVALIAATVAGCDKSAPPIPQPRPVRTVTVKRGAQGETVSLTARSGPRTKLTSPFAWADACRRWCLAAQRRLHATLHSRVRRVAGEFRWRPTGSSAVCI
jgi:hypothetical protein